MIHPDDITSLTDFKRDTPGHIRRMRKSGRPQLLTVNGKAELLVLDKKAYDKIAALLDAADTVAAVQRGMRDFGKGRVKPARQGLEAARQTFLRKKRRAVA